MEVIIVLVVIGLVVTAWVVERNSKKKAAEQEKEWPFGKKLSDRDMIHEPTDVAPGKSADDRVETPAASVAAESVTTVVENKPARKPAVKKTAAKPAATKKAPAKKKSV